MSTRGTLHYWWGGRIHIYDECIDNWVYLQVRTLTPVRLYPGSSWYRWEGRTLLRKLTGGMLGRKELGRR